MSVGAPDRLCYARALRYLTVMSVLQCFCEPKVCHLVCHSPLNAPHTPISPMNTSPGVHAAALLMPVGVSRVWGQVWSDMQQLYMRINLRMESAALGRFNASLGSPRPLSHASTHQCAAAGTAAVLAKFWTRVCTKRLGPATHLTASNLGPSRCCLPSTRQ